MSLKCNTMCNIITNPMPSWNFTVSIPGMEADFTEIVESTEFPSQGPHRPIELWYKGEKITYMGLPENGGEWKFSIPEGDGGQVAQQFKKLFDRQYDQKTGKFTPGGWRDVQVSMNNGEGTPVMTVVLHATWLKSRSNVNLDATKPDGYAKWDYAFCYNWVEDLEPGAPASPFPIES